MSNPLLPLIDPSAGSAFDVEDAVRSRYSAAAQTAEPALCCAVSYDQRFLEVLPQELIERDYGCGDPSKYLRPGERVLDLGSGGGKICYIASQIVGPEGAVVGVDMNADMLQLARQYQEQIAEKIGWNNVVFHRGRIQDLALDLDKLEQYLQAHPVRSTEDWLAAQGWANAERAARPMIANDSIDIVVSNCVLNLVRPEDRRQLFAELHRVLRPGGRAVISDIVSDQRVPVQLQQDATLWSGCIAGAFAEVDFLDAFAQAGFEGMTVLEYQAEPWSVVQGIEFRSMTVCAYKQQVRLGAEQGHSVIYRGPWSQVADDQGQQFQRGVRTAVNPLMFQRFREPPYSDQFLLVAPPAERQAASAGCCQEKTGCC